MRKIIFHHNEFFANHFWSLNDGTKIDEDILVKTYLKNYFTFSDFVKLYKIVGEKKLIRYSEDIGVSNRVKFLLKKLKTHLPDSFNSIS